MNVFTLLIGTVVVFVAFQLSNFVFLLGYDLWNDFTMSLRRQKLARSEEGKQLVKLVRGIASKLVALK